MIVEGLTAKGWIALRLWQAGKPLAIHEILAPGHSQTAISARCREMARDGIIVGATRPGTSYKEWALPKVEMATMLGSDPT